MASISERLSNKIKDNVAQEKIIKLRDKKILELNDKMSAQANHIGEIERKLAEYDRKQRDGYCWEIENKDGMIIGMGTVPAYSKFTYPQDIPKEIGTAKYSSFPFYLREQGQIKIHTKKYMRYNSI